ncbi:diaminopimelate decarboxylase [Adhaeribacter swui]|uniref:Diaminopimelate decarboxylase n=1 Tax=Adhaeribacter swui TaxID=2086471 RepID=A0A7G7GEN2_9BACT|nr:diaminopimelate decarboxylase [Adhaeribacter swui]QNF35616.1 diaminopimelate decarboxylase [Adhaeribacter swui]
MLNLKNQNWENTPTPFYYYDLELLNQTVTLAHQEAARYGYHVHYALKANSNAPILKTMQQYGFGADCVSGNEIKQALANGFGADQIVFAGVGKSDAEIKIALDADIFCFNCESVQELEIINELAAQQNTTAWIALRINPNVNANTHKYITTGLEENKFGINTWELPEVLTLLNQLTHLEFIGIHFHIGSQITDLQVFEQLCVRVNEIQQWFREQGFNLKHLNVGGGLGVDYYTPENNAIPDFAAYFAIFNRLLEVQPGQVVHFELGRALVAQCGALISRVLYIKKGQKKNFAILDAGMTELIRPMLYQAHHKIENLSSNLPEQTYDVVGPICESSDCFAQNVVLPETHRHDVIAIRTAGAYGEVMASNYNLREKATAIYSSN